ncbi:TraB/GumN family protein [Undibacterium flavidum]|uniref:TraB/GumN family protein n=1 Tax=Undibacterium flavidum TaxID=2762297 RepID=A0ABR6YAB7_9BURK|nr:TraB/GumN family protein [Undibacterium flavidum]MBC3873142.1 TraB/GumN family protein [Undibacterium flavidum]
MRNNLPQIPYQICQRSIALCFGSLFSIVICLGLGLTQTASAAEKTIKAAKAPSKVTGLLYELSLPPTPGLTSVRDSKQKKTVAYLYGTIHIAKKDFYPLAKAVKQSYASADTLVVETDITDETANRSIIGKLSYIAPDRLEHHLGPGTWNTLREMTGQSLEQFQFYKPILVAMGLTVSAGMQLGFDPEQGLDLHFIKAAQKDKKKLIELDGIEVQADVLNSLSNEEGDAILINTLNSFKNGEIRKEFERMSEAWRAGDADKLAQIFVEAANKDIGSKKITQKLIDERNPDTAKKIIELMSSGKKLFIAIGAGHMAGENNLIKLLQQQGLQVQQIR